MKVMICALGTADYRQLTLGALEAMQQHKTFLRTQIHDAAAYLAAHGVAYESFDALYEISEDFDDLCQRICGRIYEAVQKEDVVYAVAAGGGFGDATVQALCSFLLEKGVEVEFLPGVGYAENAALAVGGLDGAAVLSAQQLDASYLNTRLPLIVTEIDSAFLACDVKILLEDYYPAEHEIFALFGKNLSKLPLEELDRQENFSHLLTIIVPPVDMLSLSRYDFSRLLDIVAVLRGQSDVFPGCPWDMEQTHATMRADLIEEAYETVDAIDQDDTDKLCDELGDVLLQVAMHAQVAKEFDEFDVMDVTTAICKKMIHRHPHVFADAQVSTSAEVLAAWEKIKRGENHQKTTAQALSDIPKTLPSLMRAAKVHKKSGEYNDPEQARAAFAAAAGAVDRQVSEETVGALLMSAANLARVSGVNAEMALTKAINAFTGFYEKRDAES